MESKISPCPTSIGRSRRASLTGVRSLVTALFALGLSSVASAGPPSNPAFLGVTMDPSLPTGGCPITGVTPDSAAAAAGIEFCDWIMAIDGVFTQNCNLVSAQITAHQLGDTIKIELRRGDNRVTVRATLSTRAELWHRRLVGRALDSTEVVDLDDLQTY